MSEEPERIKLLIAGLGNSLMQDDGIGVHAVRILQENPIEGAVIAEVGTAVLDALHLLEAADAVLALDAVQAGEPPGTIYEVRFSDKKPMGQMASIHELDLRRAVAMLPENRRPDVIVLGVEPHVIDFGLELSPLLQEVLPEFVDTVRRTAYELI